MGYVIGAIAGVAAGVICVVFVGGVAGIAAGLIAAALLYLGLGALLKPERRLGGVIASSLPDGEAAATRIDAAHELMRGIQHRRAKMRDAAVAHEADDLVQDIGRLVAYVEGQPAAYRCLAHVLSTYAEQCTQMLDGYLSVERSGVPEMMQQGREDAIEALCALQGAVQGELARATGAKASQLEASSEAIQRLIEMDGHKPDAPAEGNTR